MLSNGPSAPIVLILSEYLSMLENKCWRTDLCANAFDIRYQSTNVLQMFKKINDGEGGGGHLK